MGTKIIRNLSFNTIQLVINQIAGLGIFYLLSVGINKNSFGQINLVLAILMIVFNILSLGMDQLVVKKIASGSNTASILSLYIAHVLIAGLGFYGLLLAGYYLLPHSGILYGLLLLIGVGKLMIFFSTPFKQAATGLEHFRLLAYMSVISNIIRCVALIIFSVTKCLNLQHIVMIFIGGDLAELLVTIWLFKNVTKISLNIKWDKVSHKALLFESLPQTGVVLITSALARFDWVFIGFMVSAIKLAEYSFAYKVFEMSTLPLLAIAPVLIPLFTRLFKHTDALPIAGIQLLVRYEMIIAAFTGLMLNIYWPPIFDGITSGKYGAVNSITIFILTLCMPFIYLNNLLWTMYFAQGRLKMILTSFIVTFLVNVAGDVVLIPIFKNEGAAFAFLVACIVQCVFYLRMNLIDQLNAVWQPLLICVLSALICGFAAKMVIPKSWLVFPLSIVLYLLILFTLRQIKPSDWALLRQLISG